MKKTVFALLIPLLALGALAPVQAAPEAEPMATSIPAAPIKRQNVSPRVQHDETIVMNGMTRHQLDVHPSGG